MDRIEDYNEQLDRYFRNEMGEKEQDKFLSKVNSDEQLKVIFEQHSDIVKGIELSSLKSLKKQLVQKEEELSKPPWNFSLYIKIAAGICLIAVATWTIIQFNKQDMDSRALYAANYEPYANIVTPLNRSSPIVNKDPYALFELGEYTKSLEVLNTMKNTDTVMFYKGQVYMAINSPEAAIENFNQIPSSSVFYEASVWYRALSHVAQNEKMEAREVLREIIKRNNTYTNRAEKLLDQI